MNQYFANVPAAASNLALMPCGCQQTFGGVRHMRLLPRYAVSTSCTTERLQNALECVLLNFKANIDIWSCDKETPENYLSPKLQAWSDCFTC